MRVIEVAAKTGLTESDFGKLVSLKVPIVFRKYASEWDCVMNWSKPGYLAKAASEESETCPHRKYRQFTAQSAEKGRLHLTDGKSKAKAVSIAEFLNHSSDSDGLYLLGIHAVSSGQSALSYCPVQRHADDKEAITPLSKDVPSRINFLDWYAQILATNGGSPISYDHQQFFLAKGYAFTDLHYDSYDNFYVAVSGTRRWTLGCPNASRWLIDSAGGKLKSGSACIPHQQVFPSGSPAQIYPFGVVDLSPGDVLFVPACWWHLVESVPGKDGFSCAFNFFFSKSPDVVFGDFQAQLKQADEIVSKLQGECRAKIADACRFGGVLEKDGRENRVPKIAPNRISQPVWDQLIKLSKVHDLDDELCALHEKFESYSLESAGIHLKQEPVGKDLVKVSDSARRTKSVPRTPRSSK
jgi:mannose-6-phosphate isomerase-like protein (cupin superfamily)